MNHPDYEEEGTLTLSQRANRARMDCFELYADVIEHDPRHEDDGILYIAALADAAQADDYELYQVYEEMPVYGFNELIDLAAEDGYSLYEQAATDFTSDEALAQMIEAAQADNYGLYQEWFVHDPQPTYGYSNSLFI